MNHPRYAIAVLWFGLAAFAQGPAFAEGLNIKGFGTLGWVHGDLEGADFVANYYFQPSGVGHSGETRMTVDTKAGLQLDWQATQKFGLTTQVIAKQFEDGRWTPQVEWAFAKWAVDDVLQVRLGRLRPAVYMLSDYLDVNYSNAWVRPPIEFYSSAPLMRMEGVDLLWTPVTGEWSWLVQPYLGRSDLSMPNQIELEVRDILGLNLSASRGDWTLRAGHLSTALTVDAPMLSQAFDGLAALCANGMGDPAACTQGSALRAKGKRSTFTSVGASWDNGDAFVTAEWGSRSSDSYIADASTGYLSAGLRRGKWTPYLTYATFQNRSPTRYAGSTVPVLGAMTNAIVSQLLTSNPMDQDSVGLGVRYDFARDLALKLQWDKVRTQCRDHQPDTCKGVFIEAVPAFADRSQTVDLFSVSLDFVF